MVWKEGILILLSGGREGVEIWKRNETSQSGNEGRKD